MSPIVFQNEGHLLSALDLAPRNTNSTCINSRPACLQTISEPTDASDPTRESLSSANSTCHAGYSSPWRRHSAMLPHGRPFSSTNQTFPDSSRRSSTMNKPRQPDRAINSPTVALTSSDTDCEAQALDPEPCGFIIRTR